MAAAKAYKVTRELDRARADKDGTVRTWKQYSQIAGLIIKQYNRYQVAEFNTMVMRATTAQQMERFLRTADKIPNIKWLMTTSATPRERHLRLVGLILPIGHPFWKDNQPGNLYNCKCNWINTDEAVTQEKDRPEGETPYKGLTGNPYDTGEIVTDGHPYFNGLRETNTHIQNLGCLMLPDSVGFIRMETHEGSYLEHALVRREPGIERNREVAAKLVEAGYEDISLLPQIHRSQTALRERYYGKPYSELHPAKCPDVKIGRDVAEIKNTNRHNMADSVRKAARQADIVVINVDEALTAEYMERFVRGRFDLPELYRLKRIIIIEAGRIHAFNRRAKAE
jgi:hypothetical protein